MTNPFLLAPTNPSFVSSNPFINDLLHSPQAQTNPFLSDLLSNHKEPNPFLSSQPRRPRPTELHLTHIACPHPRLTLQPPHQTCYFGQYGQYYTQVMAGCNRGSEVSTASLPNQSVEDIRRLATTPVSPCNPTPRISWPRF